MTGSKLMFRRDYRVWESVGLRTDQLRKCRIWADLPFPFVK